MSRREEEKRNSSCRRHPRSCELRPVAVGVTAPSSLPAPNEKHDGAPLLLPWFAMSERRGREDDASWRLGCCCAMVQTEPRRAVGVLTVAGKGFRPPQVSRSEEKAVPLCFDHLEWFCHFRDHRRSSGLSLCHLRPAVVTGKGCRSPLLLGADCRVAAEPFRRPPLFRFNRSFFGSCCYGYCERGWELRFWLPSVRVEAEMGLMRHLDYGIAF
ncbi:uncharacterized protein DS421_12g361280 [Arachis hypogaea]|nr:uncharacterized protein DS421_12g361280 [Arachis hypogaea]